MNSGLQWVAGKCDCACHTPELRLLADIFGRQCEEGCLPAGTDLDETSNVLTDEGDRFCIDGTAQKLIFVDGREP